MNKQETHHIERVGEIKPNKTPVPATLKTADELAEMPSIHISKEKIKDFAEAGYMPHYRFDNGEPLFSATEAKDWINRNLSRRCEGKDIEYKINVFQTKLEKATDAPVEISSIENLSRLDWGSPTGIYFLCKNNSVVYVGQSINPVSRVSEHQSSGKDFDSAYLLPVPKSKLDEVEGAFIRHLKPALNGRNKNGKMCAPNPSYQNDPKTIESYICATI